MRCTSPRTVGFLADGKTLCWSPQRYSKEFAPFQIPCGKCISCRLENARQTAVRCVHEASMYENNCFITLTYSEENLKSDRLQYKDFQAFVKALRASLFDDLQKALFPFPTQEGRRLAWNMLPKMWQKEMYEQIKIGILCAGEYGEKKKRPHWHALVFNYRPSDGRDPETNERGDKTYLSDSLATLWKHGRSNFGEVTFESAGYVARYASKKLLHGKDGTHDLEPISRRSSKTAIGKAWIEKNWKDCFTTGTLVFKKGEEYIQCGIPRYYEKWLKKHQPEAWKKYVTEVKSKIILNAIEKEAKISLEEKKINFARSARQGLAFKPQKTRNEQKNQILEQKFQQLQKHLKL